MSFDLSANTYENKPPTCSLAWDSACLSDKNGFEFFNCAVILLISSDLCLTEANIESNDLPNIPIFAEILSMSLSKVLNIVLYVYKLFEDLC